MSPLIDQEEERRKVNKEEDAQRNDKGCQDHYK